MTQKIYANNLREITNNRLRLEKEFNVKISNQGKNIFIKGRPENEYLVLKILEAVNLGFSIHQALILKNEEMILHIINIKDITKRKDLHSVRARLIGTQGKTKENIENLGECEVAIQDNRIGIIGESSCIEDTIIAIKSLIQGSKQGNVYARMEKRKKERRLTPEEVIKDEYKEKQKEKGRKK